MGKLEQIFNLQEGVQPKPPLYFTLREANAEILIIGIHPSEAPKDRADMKPNGFRIQYRPFEEKSKYWTHQDFKILPGKFVFNFFLVLTITYSNCVTYI